MHLVHQHQHPRMTLFQHLSQTSPTEKNSDYTLTFPAAGRNYNTRSKINHGMCLYANYMEKDQVKTQTKPRPQVFCSTTFCATCSLCI